MPLDLIPWLALLLFSLLMASPATAASPTTPCRVPGIRTEARCGQIARPLDPSDPRRGTLEVHFLVVPAVARNKEPDPVFLLAGGPGQSAIALAGEVLPLLYRLNNRRDLVFVDQRGTGLSAPLYCPEPPRGSLAEAGSVATEVRRRACRELLGKLPYIRRPDDLGLFTTTLAMQDLDALRAALGAPRINLVGFSYGTRAALEYQRQFPAALRRSVLDGVAPPDMVLPDSASADSQAALDAVWVGCESEPACHSAFPDLAADWARLRASLPREVTVANPVSGIEERVVLTQDLLLGLIRGPLYSPVLASGLPQAISAAAQGHYAGLVGLSGIVGLAGPARIATGMHFSVICAEDAPRMGGAGAASGRDFGDGLAVLYREACAEWPRGAVPVEFYTVPPATVPVLLLAGGLDPLTPPRHAQRMARALGANAKLVVVPNAGHGVLSLPCMSDVLYHFIAAPEPEAALQVATDCARAIPRPPGLVMPHP